jgi:hypothetical protein
MLASEMEGKCVKHCKVWGFQCMDYKDDSFMGCDAGYIDTDAAGSRFLPQTSVTKSCYSLGDGNLIVKSLFIVFTLVTECKTEMKNT